jgi:hypothetical protein
MKIVQVYRNLVEFVQETVLVMTKSKTPGNRISGLSCSAFTRIQGYISPKRADYFIWELGVFEEGSKVVLGDNLVLAKITGVVGVGRNFIKFGVENLGSSFRNKIPVKRMIVSIPPDVFHLTRSQRFKRSFFPWFLKSMKDFADADRIFDEVEAEKQNGQLADYGKIICDMFGYMDWE